MTSRRNKFNEQFSLRSKSRKYSTLPFTFCEYFFGYLTVVFKKRNQINTDGWWPISTRKIGCTSPPKFFLHINNIGFIFKERIDPMLALNIDTYIDYVDKNEQCK